MGCYTKPMLTHIHIANFAIIDQLELNFSDGFTVLTGETGAGKSIIVDAIGLALGERADAKVIRSGAERTEITLSFDTQHLQQARRWLEDNDLSRDEGCLIRRVITRDGRSRGYINGTPVPLQALRTLGDQLLDIHGQHEHQRLLQRDVQRQLLDEFGELTLLATEVHHLQQQWRSVSDELAALQQASSERLSRADFLQFQISELTEINLQVGELAALEQEQQRLSHVDRLLRTSQQALHLLEESDHALLSSLNQQLSELQKLATIDARLTPTCELLASAAVQLDEALNELRHYSERLELDPGRLAEIDQRLGAIHDLARKHRLAAEALPPLLGRLQAELATLTSSDERLTALTQQQQALLQRYHLQAQRLSQGRRSAAQPLAEKISGIIRGLGMPQAVFEIALTAVEPTTPSPHGLERVEFLISANPGQASAPLNRVASGGELSRISLAIQVIAAQNERVGTLIFDEVDSGVGGSVAEMVGQQLRALGRRHQVFCVTHLPQVAALGHHHFQVAKASGQQLTTTTTITPLTNTTRSAEIARMLGGSHITPQTHAHASEMLALAQQADDTAQQNRPKAPSKRKNSAQKIDMA